MDNGRWGVSAQLAHFADRQRRDYRQRFRQRRESRRAMKPLIPPDIVSQSCPLSVGPAQACARTSPFRSPRNKRTRSRRFRPIHRGVCHRVQIRHPEKQRAVRASASPAEISDQQSAAPARASRLEPPQLCLPPALQPCRAARCRDQIPRPPDQDARRLIVARCNWLARPTQARSKVETGRNLLLQ